MDWGKPNYWVVSKSWLTMHRHMGNGIFAYLHLRPIDGYDITLVMIDYNNTESDLLRVRIVATNMAETIRQADRIAEGFVK